MVPLTPHRVISTTDGFTQAGSISHCGPSIPIRPRPLLMAPVLPFSSRKNTEAVATAGVILGR